MKRRNAFTFYTSAYCPIKLIGKASAAGKEVTVDSAEACGIRPRVLNGGDGDNFIFINSNAHTHTLKIWRGMGNGSLNNDWLALDTAPAEVFTESETATNPGFTRAVSRNRSLSLVSVCSNVGPGGSPPPDSLLYLDAYLTFMECA